MTHDIESKVTGIFGDAIDGATLDQFYTAIRAPFVEKAALMSDAHYGYALPIGAVAATRDYVVPAWVGYDIGCGVLAIPGSYGADQLRSHGSEVMDAIYRRVPVGRDAHRKPAARSDDVPGDLTPEGREVVEARGGDTHLGTLGSGNHFIELGEDEAGTVWLVIHSGSRGPGHGLATHYMAVAGGEGEHPEGNAALHVRSTQGQNYLHDTAWMVGFAYLNRLTMARLVERALHRSGIPGELDYDHLINRSHNHVEWSEPLGLWVHRKGATHAEAGMAGVIPGTMRHGSYIVRGKGAPDSLYSSSHGAGRAMSRRAAKRNIPMKTFTRQMDGIHARVGEATLDEAPDAYKDLDAVMEAQKDLVEVVHRVHPIVNIKG